MKISGFVTVIVPVHNGALSIRRCLEAIAAQDYRPLEIVVVDDGSTDPTPAWIRAFRGQHPDVPVHVLTQSRTGPAIALQAGLWRARGEFVAFAHQADAWEPTKLSRQVRALQAAPEAAWAIGAVTEKTEDGERKKPAPAFKLGLLYEPVALSSLLLRRQALAAIEGFAEAAAGAIGHDLLSRLGSSRAGVTLQEVLAVCHRPAGAGVPAEALLANWSRLHQAGVLSRQQLQWGTGRLHALYGWRALLADEPERARAIFQAAAQADPYRFDVWLGLGCAKLDQLLFASGLLRPQAEPARGK